MKQCEGGGHARDPYCAHLLSSRVSSPSEGTDFFSISSRVVSVSGVPRMRADLVVVATRRHVATFTRASRCVGRLDVGRALRRVGAVHGRAGRWRSEPAPGARPQLVARHATAVEEAGAQPARSRARRASGTSGRVVGAAGRFQCSAVEG